MGWTQKELLAKMYTHGFEFDASSLSNIEGCHRSPRKDSFDSILVTLGLHVDTFSKLRLSGVLYDIIMLDDVVWSSSEAYNNEAERLINELNAVSKSVGKNFDAICAQFEALCRCKSDIMLGKDIAMTEDKIMENIEKTYNNFKISEYNGEVLLIQEMQLMRMLAHVLVGKGKAEMGISLLQSVKRSIDIMHCDYMIKISQRFHVVKDLIKILLKCEKYTQAHDVYETEVSTQTEHIPKALMPEFAYYKAIISHYVHGGERKNTAALFEQAYHGCLCSGNYSLADEIKTFVKNAGYDCEFHNANNSQFETDELCDARPNIDIAHKCKSIGDLLYILCDKEGLKHSTLCNGIMNKSNISRFFNDECNISVFLLECLFQRLGYEINRHTDTFVSKDDFENKQLRDRVLQLTLDGHYDSAFALLGELEASETFSCSHVNKQFLCGIGHYLRLVQHGCSDMCENDIKQALELTERNIPLDKIESTRLTRNEILLFNTLALNLCEGGSYDDSALILDSLIKNMKGHYRGGTEKIFLYPTLLRNYSEVLLKLNRPRSAIKTCDQGEELCIKYGNIGLLARFDCIRVKCLLAMGKAETARHYIARTFHVSELVKSDALSKGIHECMKNMKDFDTI